MVRIYCHLISTFNEEALKQMFYMMIMKIAISAVASEQEVSGSILG